MIESNPPQYKRSRLLSQPPDWISMGLISNTIVEDLIPLRYTDKLSKNLQAIEIYENAEGTASFPLTAVDIISNCYLRLSYQKPDGSSGTLGSSLMTAISFRTSNQKLNFMPKIQDASLDLSEELRPIITLSGNYQNLAKIIIRKKYLKPTLHGSKCIVDLNFTALQDLQLAKDSIGLDSFRFCTISSMFTPNCYDGNAIINLDRNYIQQIKVIDEATKRGAYIFRIPPRLSTMITLSKDQLSTGILGRPGAKDSPSLRLSFDQKQYPICAQGYLDQSLNINSDSLSVWLEWENPPAVIRKGQVISFSYETMAIEPIL